MCRRHQRNKNRFLESFRAQLHRLLRSLGSVALGGSRPACRVKSVKLVSDRQIMVLMCCLQAGHSLSLSLPCICRGISAYGRGMGMRLTCQWRPSPHPTPPPTAGGREISPVRKHTGITHYQGLMDAWIQCCDATPTACIFIHLYEP